jgi:hypothetical protein
MLSSIRPTSLSQSLVELRLGISPGSPADRIAWLERKCRAMRAQGLAGHWAYDLPLHRNLLTVLAAERAALAAPEILSTSPDRQDVRAAA